MTMKAKPTKVKRILASNIKKHRVKMEFTQEKLAEIAKISPMMVKDIEGCRTWVGDKTLERLATALKTDIFRLFLPDTAFEEEMNKTIRNDIETVTQKIRQNVDTALKNALKLWR
jgi:transcriptional regulator with XRE-family HTH domain